MGRVRYELNNHTAYIRDMDRINRDQDGSCGDKKETEREIKDHSTREEGTESR